MKDRTIENGGNRDQNAEERVYRENRLRGNRSYVEYETPEVRKRRLARQRDYQREYRRKLADDFEKLNARREYHRQYQRLWRARRSALVTPD